MTIVLEVISLLLVGALLGRFLDAWLKARRPAHEEREKSAIETLSRVRCLEMEWPDDKYGIRYACELRTMLNRGKDQ